MYVRVATKIGYFVEECFFTGWLEPSEVCLWSLKYFSKLKAAFCENQLKSKFVWAVCTKNLE